jgi:hypothetical protein
MLQLSISLWVVRQFESDHPGRIGHTPLALCVVLLVNNFPLALAEINEKKYDQLHCGFFLVGEVCNSLQ